MYKVLPMLFFILCNNAMADWVKWLESPGGDESFINIAEIKLAGEVKLFTVRQRLAKPTGNGEQSIENQYAMNCSENSYKILQISFYKDDAWSKPMHSVDPEDKGRIVRRDTAIEILANMVCK